MTHDQNFKNLILDYPREAMAVVATAVHLGFAPEHPTHYKTPTLLTVAGAGS